MTCNKTRSTCAAPDDKDDMALFAKVNLRRAVCPVRDARRHNIQVSLLHNELAHEELASRVASDGAALANDWPYRSAHSLPVVAKCDAKGKRGEDVTLKTTGSG